MWEVGYHGRAVLRGGEGWDRIRLPGLVAQRQSGRLITDWSLVRIQAGPPDLTKSRTFVLRFTLALQLVLRREPRPARSGPRQVSFPCPHQPARADYSPSCQADMAAIRPPLTVSGASQASLRHPPASFGIRPRCFLAAAAPSASKYGSSRSPCELRKPRSSVPLRTGPVSRNCNAWGQIDTILVHKKA